MAGNHSKTTKEVWQQVRIDYDTGNWKTIRELGERYNINPRTLATKIYNDRWNIEKSEKEKELLNKVKQVKETEAEKYLKNTFKRVLRYETIIDASLDNLGSKDEKGTPLLDPEAINDYTIAEQRVHAIARSALRIPDAPQNVDITSKGQSIGESLLSAISRFREDKSLPELTEEQVEQIIEAEIIDEKPPV